MSSQIITQAQLKQTLHYNPDTGIFTQIHDSGGKKAGSVSGALNFHGYIQISIKSRLYKAHRLARLYMTGEMPAGHTDHINHIRDDNRWINLRDADDKINSKNTSLRSDNSSGIVGVIWHKAARKWMAFIMVDSKQKYLGIFEHINDAAIARKMAEYDLDFHANHGLPSK